MLATYVRAEKTPLSFEEAAASMRIALEETMGADPPVSVLALALAKTALETGRWNSCWNFNFGNIKCSSTYEGLYCCIVLNEILDGEVAWFSPLGRLTGNPAKGGRLRGDLADAGRTDPPGHPQTRMRAHLTPIDGARDYVKFVAGGRYAGAWALLLEGDAAGYVHALKTKGYFTADEGAYTKAVASLQREFIARLAALPVNIDPVPDVETVREWLAPQDIVALEAELADRYFDLLEDNLKSAHREMLGDPDEEITKTVNMGKGIA